MKRLNLTKYGFIRLPEKDFHDDGNNFICYKFTDNESYVSKLVDDGQAYLSVHVNGELPYDVYSALPHHKRATWDFNGISVSSLTDALLQDFYTSCVEYEKEYRAAEAAIQYPTLEELTARCEELRAKAMIEYTTAQKLVIDAILLGKFGELSDYQAREVKNDLAHLQQATNGFDPKTYPQGIYKSAYSFRIMDPNFHDLVKESYWLADLKQILTGIRQ